MCKHIISIQPSDSLNTDKIDQCINTNKSIYCSNFRVLLIIAKDNYIIYYKKCVLVRYILERLPDIKEYCVDDFNLITTFSRDSIIFKSRDNIPECQLNYLEICRFKKFKMSYNWHNEETNEMVLNTKLHSIQSFEKLVDSINNEFADRIIINQTYNQLEDKFKLSQFQINYYSKSNNTPYNLAPLNTTIKTLFQTKNQLIKHKEIFNLNTIYKTDLTNLSLLIDAYISKGRSEKKLRDRLNTIFNNGAIKFVLNFASSYSSSNGTTGMFTVDTVVDFFGSSNNECKESELASLVIIVNSTFIAILKNINDINNIHILRYFDFTDFEAQLQFELLSN